MRTSKPAAALVGEETLGFRRKGRLALRRFVTMIHSSREASRKGAHCQAGLSPGEHERHHSNHETGGGGVCNRKSWQAASCLFLPSAVSSELGLGRGGGPGALPAGAAPPSSPAPWPVSAAARSDPAGVSVPFQGVHCEQASPTLNGLTPSTFISLTNPRVGQLPLWVLCALTHSQEPGCCSGFPPSAPSSRGQQGHAATAKAD